MRALPLALFACLAACTRWGTPPEIDDANEESSDSSVPDLPSGDDTTETDTETGEEFPWPEQWVIDPSARVVVWGKTGIPTKNLTMIQNVFVTLGGAPDGLTILWIGECDPREDPLGCLAGNVDPFFAMVDTIGTIEFNPLAVVDPLAYDVVVADFCGPVEPTQVATMLGEGAHVLVLGDRWCATELGLSADVANELLEHLGTRFNGTVLNNHDFLVADDKQVELLAGVPVIDAWGVALQEHIDPFVSAVGTIEGAILTSRSE